MVTSGFAAAARGSPHREIHKSIWLNWAQREGPINPKKGGNEKKENGISGPTKTHRAQSPREENNEAKKT